MSQLTLVAFYGGKAPEVSDLAGTCQDMTTAALGVAFEPYDLRQVHATILGLEHREESPRENASFRRLRGRRVEMNIPGFLAFLRASANLPFEVRIGGFDELDRPFLSRDMAPYQRSFSVQADKAVVMGWPRSADSLGGSAGWPQTLDSIRRSAQEFGILHAYHRSQSDRDNDLFFRIGLIDRGSVSDEAIWELEHRVRQQLSRQPPLILRIGFDDLCVAAYRDDRLPLGSTKVFPLTSPYLRERLAAVLCA